MVDGDHGKVGLNVVTRVVAGQRFEPDYVMILLLGIMVHPVLVQQ